ncbi:GNAT family N-acetyltransferase [Telmatospirillum siberiense]|nr:GNAT family N-acetyltransferase [Telmatospirillum siberiense]
MSGVRKARLLDAPAIARIEVETWQTTYAGILTDKSLLNMSVARLTTSWTAELRRWPRGIVVWDGDERGLLGYGQCGRQRDPALPYKGEVFMLYVTPDAQGMGIGRQLLLALMANLVASNYPSALVWVLRANPARFFYERLGARLVMNRQIPFDGRLVDALGYGWDDLSATLDQWVRSGDRSTGP